MAPPIGGSTSSKASRATPAVDLASSLLPPPPGLADVVCGHGLAEGPSLVPDARGQSAPGRPTDAAASKAQPVSGGTAGGHPRPALPVPVLKAGRAPA